MCLSENDYATPESASGCAPGPQMLIPARPLAVSLKERPFEAWSLSIQASIRLTLREQFEFFPARAAGSSEG